MYVSLVSSFHLFTSLDFPPSLSLPFELATRDDTDVQCVKLGRTRAVWSRYGTTHHGVRSVDDRLPFLVRSVQSLYSPMICIMHGMVNVTTPSPSPFPCPSPCDFFNHDIPS